MSGNTTHNPADTLAEMKTFFQKMIGNPQERWDALESLGIDPLDAWRETMTALVEDHARHTAPLAYYFITASSEDSQSNLEKLQVLREMHHWLQGLTDDDVRFLWFHQDDAMASWDPEEAKKNPEQAIAFLRCLMKLTQDRETPVSPQDTSTPKPLSPEEQNKEDARLLHESGLLGEINRLVLHPRGLAFSVRTDKGEVIGYGPLYHSDDPAGIVFKGDCSDILAKLQVFDEWNKQDERRTNRQARHGFQVQGWDATPSTRCDTNPSIQVGDHFLWGDEVEDILVQVTEVWVNEGDVCILAYDEDGARYHTSLGIFWEHCKPTDQTLPKD